MQRRRKPFYMKHALGTAVAIFIGCTLASGQANFPIDPDKKLVTYKTSIKLDPNLDPYDVYQVAEGWFKENPDQFTQKNADPPLDAEKAKKNKNKMDVDESFDNKQPIKGLDPNGYKVVGGGLLKYYGGNVSSFRLLYIKYDIYLAVEHNALTASVSNLRYYHFNQATFSKLGIYSFQGGTPCDPMGFIESLIECQHSPEEFNQISQYFGQEVDKLFASLNATVEKHKMQYVAPLPAPVIVEAPAPVKNTPAKQPALVKASTTPKNGNSKPLPATSPAAVKVAAPAPINNSRPVSKPATASVKE